MNQEEVIQTYMALSVHYGRLLGRNADQILQDLLSFEGKVPDGLEEEDRRMYYAVISNLVSFVSEKIKELAKP